MPLVISGKCDDACPCLTAQEVSAVYIDMIKRKEEVLPYWTKNDGYDHVFFGQHELDRSQVASSLITASPLGKVHFF